MCVRDHKINAEAEKKACVRSVLSNCEFVAAAAAAVIDVLVARVHLQWAFSLLHPDDSSLEMQKAYRFLGSQHDISHTMQLQISTDALALHDAHTRTHSMMHRCLLQNGLA